MKTRGYVALIHKDAGTSFGVSFPDFPGCISAGDTMREALINAAEALAGHIDLMHADGDRIPVPRTEDVIRADPGLREDLEGATLRIIEPANLPTQAA